MKIHIDLNENNFILISSGSLWAGTIRPVSPVFSAILYYSPKTLTLRGPLMSQMVHPKHMHVQHSFKASVEKTVRPHWIS